MVDYEFIIYRIRNKSKTFFHEILFTKKIIDLEFIRELNPKVFKSFAMQMGRFIVDEKILIYCGIFIEDGLKTS